jgi:hypothetical protein
MLTPEKSHHIPSTSKRRVPNIALIEQASDGDTVAARTVRRVSLGTRRGLSRGTPDALQEGREARRRHGFLPNPKTNTLDDPECSTQPAANQHTPPRS